MKKLNSKLFIFIFLLSSIVLGASFGIITILGSSESIGDLQISHSIYNSTDRSVKIAFTLQLDKPLKITTPSSAAFTIEVLDDEMWSIGSISLTVITTHSFPEGTTTHSFFGNLFQNFPTFAPIDPPESLSIRGILGDEVLVSEEYKLLLIK